MDVNTDIDIDLQDREEFLKLVKHIPALNSDKETKHNVGVYFQNIPYNPLNQTATFDYKEASDLGYFKVDFLNNSVYKDIKNDEHLDKLIQTEPMWELLEHKEIVDQLPHIRNHYKLVSTMKPTSIDQLAMVIALIRPAKKHLIGKDWKMIEKEIWIKPTNDSYYFKRSHSIAYAMTIVVQLNKIVEQV